MNRTVLRDADPAAGLQPDADSSEALALLARIVAAPPPRSRVAARPSGVAIRRIAVGGVLAGAAVTFALAAPMPWNQGQSGSGAAAYAVTRDDAGAVHFAVHWSRLTVAPNTVGYSAKAVQWQHPGSADGGVIVRPAYFPADGTFVIGVDLTSPDASTFAPGEAQLASFSAFMVIGEVPSCVP